MKGVVLEAFGQPVKIKELEKPKSPQAGEAVVRVLAAPVLAYTREVIPGERHILCYFPLYPV